MTALLSILAVLVGGGLGAVLRHLFATLVIADWRSALIVNMVASFGLGTAVGVGLDGPLMLFVAVGLCGALSTFSTFALDLVEAPIGKVQIAAGQLVGSISAASAAYTIFGG